MNNTEQNKTRFEWTNSFTTKAVIIALMVLTLLIPLGMIKTIIAERESNNKEVDIEIIKQWGETQSIIGPILHIPVIKEHYNGRTIKKEKKWVHFMPENLKLQGKILPQTRKRGIYKTSVYNSELTFTGTFKPDYSILEKYDKVLYNEANLSISIKDNRGIKGKIKALWNNKNLSFEPGVKNTDIATSGINTDLDSLLNPTNNKTYNFDIKLNISGTKTISFCPIGKTTTANIISSWPDPSFIGNFLPIKREVNNDGFTSDYEITHLNKPFPQNWEGRAHNLSKNTFGINLYLPINHYQKSLRSAKYGILIIILTTLVLLFIELSQKKEIHILQYILVSLALVLFFSILTSLSEHIGFNMAYIVASTATTALISSYSRALLKSNKLAILIGGLLCSTYTFIFILLQLKDYAFLAGNIGLFVILAIIMQTSNKLKVVSNRITN